LKFFITGLFVFFLAASGFSQEWMLDYETALSKAKVENKPVLVFFTGSDWCRPCMTIKKKVYTTDAFKDFADENLVLVMADFPRMPQNRLSSQQNVKNIKLRDGFSVRGYPTSILVDTEGNELDRWVGYDRSGANGYIKKFKETGKL